jgi:hypothetical protein
VFSSSDHIELTPFLTQEQRLCGVADERTLIGGGVDPVDPRPAPDRVDRTGRTEDEDRHAVAPGIEDRHAGVQEADIGMDGGRHRTPGDLCVAVRDRDRALLVQAQQQLRPFIAERIDDRVMQPAIAGAGVDRDVRDVECTKRLGDDVATERRNLGVRCQRCNQRPLDGR